MAGDEVVVLVGPTAVGKTAVAIALSQHWPMEVVSADSRQIYRRLNIGTAKPTRREQQRVPHHLLDLIEPGTRYNAGRFAAEAERAISEVRSRGRMPVVVGGTGFYIKALVDGLFLEPPMESKGRAALEEWTRTLPPGDLVRWAHRLDREFTGGGRQRATRAIEVALLTGYPLSFWQHRAHRAGSVRPWYIRLTVPRPVLHRRIAVRAAEMVRRGVIEEVASVLAEGHGAHAPGLDGVGIKEAVDYLHGRIPRDAVSEAIAGSTRRYAKRQETWFRHQLAGPVLTVDATRGPDAVADDIAEAWRTRRAGVA